jgi:hypothetical protein
MVGMMSAPGVARQADSPRLSAQGLEEIGGGFSQGKAQSLKINTSTGILLTSPA